MTVNRNRNEVHQKLESKMWRSASSLDNRIRFVVVLVTNKTRSKFAWLQKWFVLKFRLKLKNRLRPAGLISIVPEITFQVLFEWKKNVEKDEWFFYLFRLNLFKLGNSEPTWRFNNKPFPFDHFFVSEWWTFSAQCNPTWRVGLECFFRTLRDSWQLNLRVF